MLLGQLLPGGVEVHAVLLGDRLGHLGVVVGGARGPRRDRPFADRQRRVGDHQLGVDLHHRAEAGAAVAGPVGRVEGEHPRLELDQRRSVLGAGEALGVGEQRARLGTSPGRICPEGARCPSRRSRGPRPLRRPRRPCPSRRSRSPPGRRPLHRRLDRVGQPLAQVVAHHEPVHDHRDVVLVALVEHDRLVQHAHPVVDLDPREAVRPQLVEQLPVLALAAPHDRGEHHEAGALAQLHHLVHDLLGRLAHDRAPADRAVGLAHAGPQQAQVVVDLGHRADRRAGVAGGGLLVDRDRRRESLDRVHVGLVHLPQELAGIGRQRLDVAPLALGVDGVEGQARLARARQPRDHDEGVAGQGERDVLEVVLAGTRDADLVARRFLVAGRHRSSDSINANRCSPGPSADRERPEPLSPRRRRTPRRSASGDRGARSSRPGSAPSPRATRR